MERHGSTALNISDLVATSRRVAVSVEELGNSLAVLREQRVGSVGLPLLIVVHHVVSLRGEKSAQLLVGEELVKHVDLINCGLGTTVSDPGSGDKSGCKEVDFPDGAVGQHHEAETSVTEQALGPHVVGTVEAVEDLVDVVASAHTPFPVVCVDHVADIVELSGISLGLGGLSTFRSVVRSIGVDVVSVASLGRLESHVVIPRLVVLAEAESRSGGEERLGHVLFMQKDRG